MHPDIALGHLEDRTVGTVGGGKPITVKVDELGIRGHPVSQGWNLVIESHPGEHPTAEAIGLHLAGRLLVLVKILHQEGEVVVPDPARGTLSSVLDNERMSVRIVSLSNNRHETVEPVIGQVDTENEPRGRDAAIETGSVRVAYDSGVAGARKILGADEGIVDDLRTGADKSISVIGAVIKGAEAAIAAAAGVAGHDLLVAPATELVIGHRVRTRLLDDGVFKPIIVGNRADIEVGPEDKGRHQLGLRRFGIRLTGGLHTADPRIASYLGIAGSLR